ncbi:CAP domain-containing protein [Streptomyces sp. NPDC044571]|uniref:CAP domain-containing protein n=1 Tax=Streptomyces sp. NPDC044571 TaxID=3155371 RepID=UPI0033C6F046
MRKHRKRTQHKKKIFIAAAALGIVGIPTAAMACLGPQGSGAATADGKQYKRPSYSAPSSSASFPSAPIQNLTGSAGTPVETTPPAAQPTRAPQEAQPSTEPTKRPTAATPAKPAPVRPATPVGPPKTATPTEAPSGPAAEVVALVNQERAKAGCPALTVNAKLTSAALNHSKDMAAHANMSHTGSDGSDPGERITRAGYAWMTYGENVAYGYSTPQQVMTGWMNSPGHRENILNCAFKEIGVGLAGPNSYWTQDFGATR